MYNDDSMDKFNFISCIKKLLHNLGFVDLCNNIGRVRNINSITSRLKNKLNDEYIVYWRSEVFSSEHHRYNFYNKIKQNYEMESYLHVIKDFKTRSYIARLRSSSHNLLIERGRHLGISRENRLCPICDSIDDELHFLTACILFTDTSLRNKHRPKAKGFLG